MTMEENIFEKPILDQDRDAVLNLLQEGADPNMITDEKGMRPLHYALQSQSKEMMKLLIEKGADPNICTKEGQNLLHSAVYCEYPDEVAAYLLEIKVDPNFRDTYGWTPLHLCINQNKISYTKLLLENGANPFVPTNKGETAFSMAEEIKNDEIIKLLESFKGKYKAPDEKSLTCFQPETADSSNESVSIEKNTEEDEYLIDRDITKDKEMETKLRKVITNWADEIPHHGIKKMGEKVEIDQISYRPAYLMILSSLYDNRTVTGHFVPYTGQNVPPLKYNDISQVKEWDFTLNQPEGFQNTHDKYMVEGSQRVETCHTCSGHGEITCPKCNGAGNLTCDGCGGKGDVMCYGCMGSGKTLCGSCSGSGYTTRYVSKTYYDGHGNSHTTQQRVDEPCSCYNGYRRCPSCGGEGRKQCIICGGKGIVTCSRCGGKGSVTCPTCNGHKRLYHYFSINQTVRPRDLTKCLLEPHVLKDYPLFYIDPLKNKGLMKIKEQGDSLKDDLLDSTVFSKSFRSLQDNSKKSSPFDNENGTTRRIRQRIQVMQMDVYDIRYRYNGKEYKLLVWGHKDDLKVYAQTSHFSELRDDFLKKAESRAKLRLWGKTFNWLDKADDLDMFNEEKRIYELKKQVEQKMYRQYRIGLFTGSILSCIPIGWFSLKYFAKDHFIHPFYKSMFFQGMDVELVHPYAMTGLFILMLLFAQKRMNLFMQKYYNNKIRMELVRWFFPFVVSFISSLIVWSGIWAFSTSGVGLYFTRFVIWAIKWGLSIWDFFV